MIRRISPKQRKRLSTWARVSAERLEQTGGLCEVNTDGCWRIADKRCHHRRLKSQGGKEEISNAVAVCFMCHCAVHQRPGWAEANGWIITRRNTD